MQKRRNTRPAKMYDEIVLDTKAVVKVTKGGRQRRFQAVVLVGDKKGLVGLGTGKANEISEAVKKSFFTTSCTIKCTFNRSYSILC